MISTWGNPWFCTRMRKGFFRQWILSSSTLIPITYAIWNRSFFHLKSAVVFFILICSLFLQSNIWMNDLYVDFFHFFNHAIRNPICPKVILNYFPKRMICLIRNKKVIYMPKFLIFICILRVVAYFLRIRFKAGESSVLRHCFWQPGIENKILSLLAIKNASHELSKHQVCISRVSISENKADGIKWYYNLCWMASPK